LFGNVAAVFTGWCRVEGRTYV